MPVLKNARQELFAQELAKGNTAIAAYEAAGYKPDRGAATRLSAKVSKRVEELVGRSAERAEVSIERVLSELAKIGFANMHDYMRTGADGDPYLDFSKLTRDQAAALQEVTVEDFKEGRGESARDVRRVRFKLADKRAALVDLGKHLGMFKDEGGGGGNHVNISVNPPADVRETAKAILAVLGTAALTGPREE